MWPDPLLPEWFGRLGPMGWPLALCSLLLLMVSLERLVFMLRSWLGKKAHYQQLSDYLAAHQSLPKTIRDEMMNVTLSELQASYYNGVRFLRMIGLISPMFGLLGTVLGIIKAFRVIAVHTGPVSPGLIATGLWEAMLTTAAGLIIALPALLLAQLCQHSSDRYLSDLCLRLNKLSLSFEVGIADGRFVWETPAGGRQAA